MRIAIIAAVAQNRVIGREGVLPWHISEDLRRFKRLTTGRAVVMGRKTYESIGKPLPQRRNIVLSSTTIPRVECYHSVQQILSALRVEETIFIIGGAALYTLFLELADDLYLTFIHRNVDGDALFPPYKHLLETLFLETAREDHGDHSFVDYRKI